MRSEKTIIDSLLESPEDFKTEDLIKLIKEEDISSKDLRRIILRIFDLNIETVLNKSAADKGLLGIFNRWSRKQKEKIFWKKIKSGKFSKIILAEGDSWFEYPLFIHDITDHLIDSENNYAVFSQAYGGDWIANILFEKEYIEELSLLKPDVFLISGGGNDIVGNYRLAHLLHRRNEIKKPPGIDLDTLQGKLDFAAKCLNKEFSGLLNLFNLQYNLLINSITPKDKKKFESLRIITQGYDYGIPSSKKGFGIIRPITNYFADNGKWLKPPLLLRGYDDEKEQVAIVTGMIHRFNDMLIEVGKAYDNVYHIDSRGSVNPQTGWYNELHPKSKEFKEIVAVFEECIESSGTSKKVFTAP